MKSSNMAKPVYIAFRVGGYYATPQGTSIVEQHNMISEVSDSVFLGKAGRSLTPGKIRSIEKTIAEEGSSKLYLIQRLDGCFEFHVADVFGLSRYAPEVIESIPEYYRNRTAEMSLWFEIGRLSPCKEQEYRQLRLLSSGRPLHDVLTECRTTLMLVTPTTQ